MSGPNLLPVNAVANSSNFSAAPRDEISADTSRAILGAERQVVAGSGENLPSAASENKVVSTEGVKQAVEDIKQRVDSLERKLELSVNEDLGKIVVTVFDKASEEVIRQIPGEQAIAIAEHIASLSEEAPVLGLLLDNEA